MLDNKTAHMASEYDSKILSTIPNYSHFHSETIDLVRTINPEPEKWLDTGCGTCTFILSAVDTFRSTEFYLADPSDEMMKITSSKLEQNEYSMVKALKNISSQNLDYPTNSFDIITAIQAHHYLDNETRLKATQNCYRMLKPNGVFITFENIRPFSQDGIKFGLERWKSFQIRNGKSPEEALKHANRFGKEYFPITIIEHLELYKMAGFSTVEVLWTSYMQAGFYAIK